MNLKLYKKQLFPLAILLIYLPVELRAQCGITAFATPTSIVCGDSVSLDAVNSGQKPLNNNFNTCTLGNWTAVGGCAVTNGIGNYACSGPSPEGSCYIWLDATANTPRYLMTPDANLTSGSAVGATACFYMKYGVQANAQPCEGPDLPAEGVYLEYSTNAGSTWVQIQYWDPNGGFDANLTQWKQYCINLPAASLTASTRFRWIQKQCSGIGYDAWGVDDCVVTLSIPGYHYKWLHNNLAPSLTAYTPKVAPTQNTTYTITYSNKWSGGTDTCSSSVSVNVTTPTTTVMADKQTICKTDSVHLSAKSQVVYITPSTCSANKGSACDPFNSISSEKTVGTGTIVNGFNSGNTGVFGDFGYAYCTTQILFRASELTAAGMSAGQINSLSFNISNLQDGSSNFSTSNFQNFSVSMGCTNISTLTAFQSGLSKVYNPKTTTINSGGWTGSINFDNKYDWDGKSNLIVQTCWYLPNGQTFNGPWAFTVDNNTSYKCLITSETNFSPGACNTTDFLTNTTQRPNTKFGMCNARAGSFNYAWSSNPAGFSSSVYNPVVSPSSTTTYMVTVTVPNEPAACSGVGSLVVNVGNLLVNISPTNPQVCNTGNKSVVLTANATINGQHDSIVSYLWSPATALSSTTVASPTASPMATTTYTVNVTDASGCTSQKSVVVSYCASTAIVDAKELPHKSFLKLYPNPANEQLSIHYLVEESNSTASILITDILGRTVLVKKLSDTKGVEKIAVQALAEGTYILLLRENEAIIQRQKFTITR